LNILGIETACDDTSASVVQDGKKILSNVIWGQKQVHQKFGGVVPELAARRHTEVILYVIQEAINQASVDFKDIDAVAVNSMRGLLRSVVVGVSAAKAIAYSLNIPVIGVHHIEGHIYSLLLSNPELSFPFICLTVSGGHNILLNIVDHGKYELLGHTLDDAAGEAFDKVAKLLGLGFPGGPIIDQLSSSGNSKAYNFPRPMLKHPNYDFSFSGLKTAVLNVINDLKLKNIEINIHDIAASFQQAVIDVLYEKTIKAAYEKKINKIGIAGGVSANNLLRETFKSIARKKNLNIYFPELSLCTDNGAMIASLAYYKYKQGNISDMKLDAYANIPIGR